MSKKIFLWVFILLGIVPFAFSQPSEDRMGKAMERVRETEERILQELKRVNPEAYEQRMKVKEISQKISDILVSFHQGKFGEEEARRKLSPLVKQLLEGRIRNLDMEIRQAEKKLEFLKKTKRDPDFLVNQRIDFYLGKGSPEDRLLSSF